MRPSSSFHPRNSVHRRAAPGHRNGNIAHPAVACGIPATAKGHHMQDNMAAGFGKLPTDKMRKRMLNCMESL